MQKEIINLQGINIEYSLSGIENEQTILFVHGLGANLSQFENQHRFFQNNYKVLSLNLRGHGNTTSINKLRQSDFDLRKISNDIFMLLDKLEIRAVHFVGNSMGGNIGYELLKSNPSKLLSFTTFGTTAKLNKSNLTVIIMKLFYKLLSVKTIAKLSKSVGQSEYSKNKIYKMFLQTSKQTILNLIPYLAKFDYTETIKSNQIPTLLIKGEKDKEINNILNSTIAAYIEKENFNLIEMKRVGHFANLDSPNEFNQKLKNFINSL
jgi:3-oxoadipate enol-lactonase